MSHQPRGLYRTENAQNGARYAWVDYGAPKASDVSEQDYREKGYQPPFERLPLKEEYEALPKGYGPGDSAK